MAGGTLIEALIAVVVIGIMGAGTLSVSARVADTQASTNQQQLAVTQMSNLLRSGAVLCNGAAAANPLPTIAVPGIAAADLTLSVAGCGVQNITVNGTAIATAKTTLRLTLTKTDTNTIIAQVGR